MAARKPNQKEAARRRAGRAPSSARTLYPDASQPARLHRAVEAFRRVESVRLAEARAERALSRAVEALDPRDMEAYVRRTGLIAEEYEGRVERAKGGA